MQCFKSLVECGDVVYVNFTCGHCRQGLIHGRGQENQEKIILLFSENLENRTLFLIIEKRRLRMVKTVFLTFTSHSNFN